MSVNSVSSFNSTFLSSSQDPSVLLLALQFLVVDAPGREFQSMVSDLKDVSAKVQAGQSASGELEALLNQQPQPTQITLQAALLNNLQIIGAAQSAQSPPVVISFSEAQNLYQSLGSIQDQNQAALNQVRQVVTQNLGIMQQLSNANTGVLQHYARNRLDSSWNVDAHVDALALVKQTADDNEVAEIHSHSLWTYDQQDS